MRAHTRSRQVAGAAAAALALALSACGSDDSGGSSEGDSSSSKESSAESGEGSGAGTDSDSQGSDEATGSSGATVDGTKLKTDGWRNICARSPDGKSGSALLLEDVSLEDLNEDKVEIGDVGSVNVHFDIKGDRTTVTHVSMPSGDDDSDSDAVGYTEASSPGDATMTMTEDAVHVEGEGEMTDSAGKRREGIPFTIDVACSSWQDLTNEGDVQQPGG